MEINEYIYIYNFKIYHFQLSCFCDCHMNCVDDHRKVTEGTYEVYYINLNLKTKCSF